MRRAGTIGIVTSALLVAGVITGGMLAVGQELDVDDHPGEQLALQGVETGDAAQDAAGQGSVARIKADGTTPKVEESVVVEQPVVDEVKPPDPVVIAPPQPASAPLSQDPAPPPPDPEPANDHDENPWGDGDRTCDHGGPDGGGYDAGGYNGGGYDSGEAGH